MADTKKVVLIDGCRTPFLRSGTDYKDMMAYQLGQMAINGLLERNELDPNVIDRVMLGTTVHNIKTHNVAREAALTAGVSYVTPCHTVSQACISANQAITSGYDQIQTGQADVVIAGGTDCVSDIPIQFNKNMRKKLFNAQKLKTVKDKIQFALSLKPNDFVPEQPSITEFITNRTMGEDCDIMASRYGISREAQDDYAVRSHQLAAKATEEGKLADEIVPAEITPSFKKVYEDNGIRGDTTKEKLQQLKPAFYKQHGTLTPANSSFLTDGASATLIMTANRARQLNVTPKAVIHSFAYSGQDPEEELLLGPTYATSKVLEKSGLTLDDIDVFELHEAFAAQILTNLQCMASDQFAKDRLGRDKALGEIPMEKLNRWGGSLSLGHPFGATGARITTTAANRLHAEDGKYALVAACAGGAHGHAMILERY